jgi:hypothetical protein
MSEAIMRLGGVAALLLVAGTALAQAPAQAGHTGHSGGERGTRRCKRRSH